MTEVYITYTVLVETLNHAQSINVLSGEGDRSSSHVNYL